MTDLPEIKVDLERLTVNAQRFRSHRASVGDYEAAGLVQGLLDAMRALQQQAEAPRES